MIDAKRETNLRTALAGKGKVSVGGRAKETSMRSPLTFKIWKIHHDGNDLANSKRLSTPAQDSETWRRNLSPILKKEQLQQLKFCENSHPQSKVMKSNVGQRPKKKSSDTS